MQPSLQQVGPPWADILYFMLGNMLQRAHGARGLQRAPAARPAVLQPSSSFLASNPL